MNIDEFTMSYSLVHVGLPTVAVQMMICAAWLVFCRWYRRDEQRTWQEALHQPSNGQPPSIDAQIDLLRSQRALAAKGSPVDRLFITGLVALGSVGLVGFMVVVGWM